jgi:hypothetical protein
MEGITAFEKGTSKTEMLREINRDGAGQKESKKMARGS